VEIIERLEGHYEAQEVPFGIVYSWSPECLVAECGCGERVALTPLYEHLRWVRDGPCGYRPRMAITF